MAKRSAPSTITAFAYLLLWTAVQCYIRVQSRSGVRQIEIRDLTQAAVCAPPLPHCSEYPLCEGAPHLIGTGICTACKLRFDVHYFFPSLNVNMARLIDSITIDVL